jgi:steroid delta-isomerase-like uncharacterized protein
MDAQETNKQLILRYVEAFNRCDLPTLRTLFTDDAVVHGVFGMGSLDKVIPMWEELHRAFAIHLTVQEVIVEGDHAAVRYVESGTFQGDFRANPPTGRSFQLVTMEWFHLRDGKIAQRWGARDFASQARQIGLPLI